MSKLERKIMNIYGENAAEKDIIAYGSDIIGNIVQSKDPDVIQTQAYSNGVRSAVVGSNSTTLQNRMALDFLFSRQLKYLFQKGVPEWKDTETYYIGSFVSDGEGRLFASLIDDNIGHETTDENYWASFPTPEDLRLLEEKINSKGHMIGEVFYSQSSLASDNAGALPLFTGETIVSADTIYPDFYKWVSEHTELQCNPDEYENALSVYGECPKYCLQKKEGTSTNYYGYDISSNTSFLSKYKFVTGGETFETTTIYTQKILSDLTAGSTIGTRAFILKENGSMSSFNIVNKTTEEVVSSSLLFRRTDNNCSFDMPDGDVNISLPANEEYEIKTIEKATYTVDGSLRLPKLTNYIKMANTVEGITQEGAGLPDITGTLSGAMHTGAGASSGFATGAFAKEAQDSNFSYNGGAWVSNVSFDASRSSEVYGNSDTVTPAHTTLYPWVYAYSDVIPASTAQASEFQEGLSGKADTNLGNIPANYDYVVESYNDGTNWYRVYKSGRVEQGGYSTGATTKTITFLKPFATETPTITCTGRTGNIVVHTTELSSTTFKWHDSATAESVGVFWRAEGQGA